ncbi:MAG: hypothetical protein ABW122_11325 [Ilumatobacteraceae bacterium]
MIVVRALVGLAGAVIVLLTLGSALLTVVVPRARMTRLTWFHFVWIRRVFVALASPRRPFAVRDRILAVYAPFALAALPGAWLTVVIVAFSFVFWGCGIDPYREALAVSGSSLTTLGFERPDGLVLEVISVIEAAIGLGLVALMISYLPTIYTAFQRREARVGGLQVRAGLPPEPTKLYRRYVRIGWLDRLGDELFPEWEDWFIDIEESHTSQAALVFFRSPHPDRSWITAAGCVLDAAALHNAVIDLPHDPRADILLRSGFLCLRRIASSFEMRHDDDPRPDDPISISREEFDDVCAELAEAGVPLVADLDQGWRDFAGWRVNYDVVLGRLAELVVAPEARWSTDRHVPRSHLPLLRPRRA